MNRDAQIGIVVILIIVGLLVVIWGRGETEQSGIKPDPENAQKMPGADLGTDGDGASSGTGTAAGIPGSTPTTPDLPRPVEDTTDDPGTTAGTTTDVPPRGGETPAVATLPIDDTHKVVDAPKPSAKPWTYTVLANDSLGVIAQTQLGSTRRWPEIAQLNSLAEPYRIFASQKLKMPPKGVAPTTGAPAETTPTPELPTKARKYVVRAGDMGIRQIAFEQCGDVGKWNVIVKLNSLKPPFEVEPGQELQLPE